MIISTLWAGPKGSALFLLGERNILKYRLDGSGRDEDNG